MNLGLEKNRLNTSLNFEQRVELLSIQLQNLLKTESPDVLFLQEAWHTEGFNVFEQIRNLADDMDYISVFNTYREINNENPDEFVNHGLDILIQKTSTFTSSGVMGTDFEPLPKPRLERMYGIEKGLLYTKVLLSSNVKVFLATSHFTPNFVSLLSVQNEDRKSQALKTAQILKEKSSSSDLVIFGADLNFSPEFEDNNGSRHFISSQNDWIENSENYSLFFEETHMIDTFYVANPNLKGFTQNRSLNPMARLYTAVSNEPDQRCDFIWIKSSLGVSFAVESSKLIFDHPLIDANGHAVIGRDNDYLGQPLYMSDRFGVISEVSIY